MPARSVKSFVRPLVGSVGIACAVAVILSSVLSVSTPLSFAANLITNADIESGSTTPDNWTTISGTIARDTTFAHGGIASLLLTDDDQAIARSDNMVVTGNASYTLSYWYNLGSSTNVSSLWVQTNYYSDAGCTAFVPPVQQASSIETADGAWHQVSDTVVAPAGAVCAQVRAIIQGAGGISAHFDDFSLDLTPPTQTPTSTATNTATLTPTSTTTSTETPTATSTVTSTATVTPTHTANRLTVIVQLTQTRAGTPVATSPPTVTGTPTNTPTVTQTRTPGPQNRLTVFAIQTQQAAH